MNLASRSTPDGMPATERAPSVSRFLVAGGAIMTFLIAVVVRLPCCYESLWLDELHSAWAVWGDFADVGPRAKIGHQSPIYFQTLWLWKRMTGPGELALRMSSVLAVAAAASILTLGVSRWTRSLAGGATSGLALALENNSIFFGTELRPYASVILFTSIAVAAFLSLQARPARDRRAALLVGAVLLAALCQPTSLGVLGWLPLALLFLSLHRLPRSVLRPQPFDAAVLAVTLVVAYLLWRWTLRDSWTQQQAWASFASAKSLQQWWDAWDWTWMLIVPLGSAAALHAWSRPRGTNDNSNDVLRGLVYLSVVAVVATASYWIVAWAEWLPVWHRRYFVAVLPILAAIMGGAVGSIANARNFGDDVIRQRLVTRFGGPLSVAVGLGMIGGLVHRQGTLAKVDHLPIALVRRGEDWRGAAEHLAKTASDNDMIYLDSGLIEGQKLIDGGSRSAMLPSSYSAEQQSTYLTFPLQGPYQPFPITAARRATGATLLPTDPRFSQVDNMGNPNRVFVVTRRTPQRISAERIGPNASIRGFGNVTVITLPASRSTGQKSASQGTAGQESARRGRGSPVESANPVVRPD